MRPVVMPILEANMTQGVVSAWLKREGNSVQPGDPLFEVETDKINAEVEAEASGVVRKIVAPVGTRVPVLGLLAFIGAADEVVPAPETWSALAAPPGLPAIDAPAAAHQPTRPAAPLPVATSRIAASPAARRLSRERGIALEQIRPTGSRGEVVRADVEDFLAAPVATSPGSTGRVDPEFLYLLRRDGTDLRALSSDAKIQLYRRHGAQIGEGVRIEGGALIIAPEIMIGAMSTIGADSTIECDRLHLGRLVAFGERTRVRCRSVEIGDALWSRDDVVIGGGGADESGARLYAGDACFFGEGAYLNTCHPITLGDEVCIGSRAMMFTHSHWQSILLGYPALFGPITVGDHVFIGNQAFVFPGVRIGAGATVMVNSFVAINVPPDTLVGGVPARVIRHVVAPTPAEQVALVRERILPELASALVEYGHMVKRRNSGDTITLDLGDGSAVQFVPSWETAPHFNQRRTVALTFADDAVLAPAPGVTVFDLRGSRVLGEQDALSDQVREYCRRRGLRFRPFAWRFRVGHFDDDRFVQRRQA